MMKSMAMVAALFGGSLSLAAGSPPAKYAEGQIWEYHTRPQDAGSLLKIQKIGVLAGQRVYHISVIGVHFKTPGIAPILPHLPVSNETLDASVVRLSDQRPAFPTTAVDEGIAEWRAAEGGVFTVSIAEILNFVEETLK